MTDNKDTYEVHMICWNCGDTRMVAFKKGTEVHPIRCTECGCETMRRAKSLGEGLR